MAFCGAPTLAVLLQRFIPLTLGHCKWLTTGYTSNHWPCPLRSGLWALSSVNFPHSLQFCSVSNCTSMLLLAEQFMVAKECASLCGKEYNHFSLFSFITAAYLVMLFFSWHPLSCTCPCLLTFNDRSWDFIRKKMWLFFSLIFCHFIEKKPFLIKLKILTSSSSLCGMNLVIRGSVAYWVEWSGLFLKLGKNPEILVRYTYTRHKVMMVNCSWIYLISLKKYSTWSPNSGQKEVDQEKSVMVWTHCKEHYCCVVLSWHHSKYVKLFLHLNWAESDEFCLYTEGTWGITEFLQEIKSSQGQILVWSEW